jgi:hypothetical protein
MMEILQKQQGDQGCPNLDAKSIFGCADEGFDFQVLLEGLEEDLDFPSIPVDSCDGRGTESQVVGQQNDLTFFDVIPNHDTPEKMGAFYFGAGSGQPNDLIGTDGSVRREFSFFDHLVDGIVLHPGDKEDARCGPMTEKSVIVVGAIESDNGALGQVQELRYGAVVPFGLRNVNKRRHVVIVVEQHVHFHTSLGASE